MDLLRVDKPDIVALILHELRLHLQKLQPAVTLEKATNLEALNIRVSLELLRLQELEFIEFQELSVVDGLASSFIRRGVHRRLEPHSDAVLVCVLPGEDARLDVVHDGFVDAATQTQFFAVVQKLILWDSVQVILLQLARVDLRWRWWLADRLLRGIVIALVVVDAHPSMPLARLLFDLLPFI